MFRCPSVDGGWTDINHDAMRLPDVLTSMNWTNEDCHNRPGWGVRTRSGAIRSTFEAISSHLGKSTSLLNEDLFGKRFEALADLMPFLATLDGRMARRRPEM